MSTITLDNISLDYIVKTGTISLKHVAVGFIKSLMSRNIEKEKLFNGSYRALENVSLNIKNGDRLGILGRNGAGKSTLLKVLAKVYKPKIGCVEINGKISTMFDVSLGLNVEVSGYENIILQGIIRGLSKKKAISLCEDISEFTELGDFIWAPVRTYSTGMQMKLAFAIATAIPSDILLIDEIIGAGDLHFMGKAISRLKQLVHSSNILVLTSHSNDIIRQFCNKVLVLDKGQVVHYGDVDEGIEYYVNNFS